MKAEHDKDGNRPLERVVSLRPCPFCGSASVFLYSMHDDQDGRIVCRECGGAGPVQCVNSAINDSWNRREKYGHTLEQENALVTAAVEVANDLESELNAKYTNGMLDYPCMRKDYDAEMQPVKDLRAALAAFQQANA